MSDTIINRVSKSPLVLLDFEEMIEETEVDFIDLKPFLFEELVLREKDFRTQLKETDFSLYSGKSVGIYCSCEAIIPKWAIVLMGLHLNPFTKHVFPGSPGDYQENLLMKIIHEIDVSIFQDKKVILKGCGKFGLTEAPYVLLASLLQPHVSSIMYGEPCSTVPLYKRR